MRKMQGQTTLKLSFLPILLVFISGVNVDFQFVVKISELVPINLFFSELVSLCSRYGMINVNVSVY